MKKHSQLNRQFRQFKGLAQQINRLIAQGSWQAVPDASQQQSRLQLKKLFKRLRPHFGQRRLRRVLASAVLVLGLNQVGHGQVTFTGPITNPFGLTTGGSYLYIPELVDMDGDGDLDIMAVQQNIGISYYENVGTPNSPQFSALQANPFNLDTTLGYLLISFGDLDNDGDFDIIAGGSQQGLGYIENTGSPTSANFPNPQLGVLGLDTNSSFSITLPPQLVDIDADGDLDIIAVEENYYTLNIKYLENTGTVSNPHFELPVNNPFGLIDTTSHWSPAFVDLDQDGDWDVFTGILNGNFSYQENINTASNPLFTAANYNPFGIQQIGEKAFLTFGDLDGDGDLDLLLGEYYGDVLYYQNDSPVGAEETDALVTNFSLSPNPAHEFCMVQAQFPLKEQWATIQLLDLMGKQLLREVVLLENGKLRHDLAIGHQTPGIYLLQIQVGEHQLQKKVVIQ